MAEAPIMLEMRRARESQREILRGWRARKAFLAIEHLFFLFSKKKKVAVFQWLRLIRSWKKLEHQVSKGEMLRVGGLTWVDHWLTCTDLLLDLG